MLHHSKFIEDYGVLKLKLNLDGQGRQQPAATDQPPATSCMPPAAFTPPSTAAFTLEG
jgi:hypothetical protein